MFLFEHDLFRKPMSTFRDHALSWRDQIMKRVFDTLGAAFLLLVGWPVLLLLLAWIRLETPGPAIFAQRRIGQGGRPFTCYKLRTMFAQTPDLPTHQVDGS